MTYFRILGFIYQDFQCLICIIDHTLFIKEIKICGKHLRMTGEESDMLSAYDLI